MTDRKPSITLPKLHGLYRVDKAPKAVELVFDRPLTDDEMRNLHDYVRALSEENKIVRN